VNAYIQTKVLDFGDDLQNLVRGGNINVTRRKQMEEVLNGMENLAAGATGFLADGDNPGMKKEIGSLLYLINNLREGQTKKAKTTRDLVALAQRVVKFWA
jgi:hypothetical protein